MPAALPEERDQVVFHTRRGQHLLPTLKVPRNPLLGVNFWPNVFRDFSR